MAVRARVLDEERELFNSSRRFPVKLFAFSRAGLPNSSQVFCSLPFRGINLKMRRFFSLIVVLCLTLLLCTADRKSFIAFYANVNTVTNACFA